MGHLVTIAGGNVVSKSTASPPQLRQPAIVLYGIESSSGELEAMRERYPNVDMLPATWFLDSISAFQLLDRCEYLSPVMQNNK